MIYAQTADKTTRPRQLLHLLLQLYMNCHRCGIKARFGKISTLCGNHLRHFLCLTDTQLSADLFLV
jgi:hypothetical protein